MDSWTLLRLNPRLQIQYVDHVAEHMPNIETYYPVYVKKTRPHGQRYPVYVKNPVYPGYVFVKLNIEGGMFRYLITTPIKAYYIKFGGNISTIPEKVIDKLRGLEARGLLVREIQRENPFKPGKMVRVHLPYADITAVIIRLLKRQNMALIDTPIGRTTVHIHKMSVL